MSRTMYDGVFVRGMKIPKNCMECTEPGYALNVDIGKRGAKCPYCERIIMPSEHSMRESRHPDCPLQRVPVPTIHGYEIEELILFAEMCRKAGVTEEDMRTFAQDCRWALEQIQEENARIIDEVIKKYGVRQQDE